MIFRGLEFLFPFDKSSYNAQLIWTRTGRLHS
jgi:hypothetical protein